MALDKNFLSSPHAILDPTVRWTPSAGAGELDISSDKLLPPLVEKLRLEVKDFRENGYAGASETSRSLLKWWFTEIHPLTQEDGSSEDFQYYFAQREALETII